MPLRATATFEITAWDQSVYDDPADGPPLGRATVKKSFLGEIEGESVAELLLCQSAEGAGYLASERVTARIGDRAGTFVIQHGGLQDGEATENFGRIVPGSATGDLAGLRGEGRFLHDERGAVFTLDYEIS